jgi:hypothetical protein
MNRSENSHETKKVAVFLFAFLGLFFTHVQHFEPGFHLVNKKFLLLLFQAVQALFGLSQQVIGQVHSSNQHFHQFWINDSAFVHDGTESPPVLRHVFVSGEEGQDLGLVLEDEMFHFVDKYINLFHFLSVTEALAALEVDEGKSEFDDFEALVEAGFIFVVAHFDLL